MADYYPLIARAIAGLDANASGEQRRALYERARAALIAQLRGVTPPLNESEITRERLTLEEAIRKVEQEAAQRARGARADSFARRGGDALKGAAARGSVSGAAAPAADRPSTRAERERERERSRPIPERDDGPMIRPRSPESRDLDWDETPPEPQRPEPPPPPRPEAPQQGRGERSAPLRRPDRPNAPPQPPQRDTNGTRGFRDVVADADDLGGAAVEANRAARRTYANVPSPTPEFDRLEPTLEDRAAEQMQGGAYNFEPGEAPPPVPMQRGRPQRPPEPRETRRKPVKVMRSIPVGRLLAFGLLLIFAGIVIWQWPNIRGLTRDLLSSSTPSQQQPAQPKAASDNPQDKPKIVDRVGQPGPQAPVAQRVVLYDEDPSDPQGKQYVGQVVWRTDQVGGSNGQPSDIAIRADVEIPDRKFKMTFLIRRNNDSSLPASHTAELTFILPPDFVGGGIANVPGVLMKSNEQARGTPLAGLAVKVTDGFFLIGLSNVDADRARNIQLLKERSWFDIPLVYANKQRAIIAIEKGSPGERAFNDAFAAWGQ
jgi:hypothetical protein